MANSKNGISTAHTQVTIICPFCDGLGVYRYRNGAQDTCGECDGQGFVESYESTHMKMTWKAVLDRYPFLVTDE